MVPTCNLRLGEKKSFESQDNKGGSNTAMSESKMIRLLWECYRDKKYTDLSIVYQGVTYQVHKAVVCKQSPVLEAMCSSSFKEGQESIVNLDGDEDLDVKQIRCLIEFLYKFEYCSFGSRPATRTASNIFGTSSSSDITAQSSLTSTNSAVPSASSSSTTTPVAASVGPPAVTNLFGMTSSAPTTAPTTNVFIIPPARPTGPPGGLFGSTISSGSASAGGANPRVSSGGFLFGNAPTMSDPQSSTNPPATTNSSNPTTSANPPPTAATTPVSTGGLFRQGAVKSPSPGAAKIIASPVSKMTQVSLDSEGNILTAKFHAQMYALADKYDIKDLSEHSKAMYAKTLEEHGAPIASTEFYDSIVTVYTSTPESDRGLRDIVALYTKKHNSWIWRHRLREIIGEVPMFAADVLDLMV